MLHPRQWQSGAALMSGTLVAAAETRTADAKLPASSTGGAPSLPPSQPPEPLQGLTSQLDQHTLKTFCSVLPERLTVPPPPLSVPEFPQSTLQSATGGKVVSTANPSAVSSA